MHHSLLFRLWLTSMSSLRRVDGTEGVAPSSSLDRQDSTTLNASTIAALLRKTQIHIVRCKPQA